MKYILQALLAAASIFWVATARTEPVTLEVAVFPSLDQVITAALPAWTTQHPDVKIKIVLRNYGDHNKVMMAALSDGDDHPDVMAVEIEHLKQFAESDALENLARLPYKGLLYRRKFVDYTFPLAASSKGEMVAMPNDIGPGTLFYRHDLLEKAGLSEADLTRSWEAYVEAGKKIKTTTGHYLIAHASDIANMVLRSNLKSGEGAYFDKDNHPSMESPRFVKAFELAKAARDAKLDARARLWSAEGMKIFQRGMIATSISGTSWFNGYFTGTGVKQAGSWRAADLPGGAFAYLGGTYYAIPKHSRNKEMAWEFVKFLTLDKGNQIKAFKLQNAFPALLEAQLDPFFDLPIDALGGQKARLMWRSAARRIPPIKVSEYDSLAYEIVEQELDKVLEGGKDIPSALRDARMAIEEKIAETRKAR